MIVDGPQIPLLSPHTAELRGPEGGAAPAQGVDGSFQAALENAIGGTNADLNAATAAGDAFAAGARDDIHGTMLALSQADIELKFVSNVRSKVLDAFYELWRMQI